MENNNNGWIKLEISYGKHQIIHKDKILENEVKFIEIMHLYEQKKITVQKRTIKNKTYNSYVIGMPDSAIHVAIETFMQDDVNKSGCIILEKIDNQVYKLALTDELKPEMIKLENIEYFDIKNKTYKITLPKKKIRYLQAYDKYLETIEYINNKYNKEFKPADIIAFIIINIAPADDEYLQKEVILRFYTDIDDKFKHSLELINDEMPEWFDILTAIPKQFLPSTFI